MTLFRCTACGHTLFPARLLCPHCGEGDWASIACGSGRVEAVTTLGHGEARLAAVRVEGGVTVLARMDGTPVPGDIVALDERTDGAVIARSMEDCDA